MTGQGAASPWQKKLADQLPLLGHRNWIVIADSAYPWQNAPGIETLATGEGQLTTVQFVLDLIGQADHVRPIVYLDAELPYLAAEDAPGIKDYRAGLDETLSGHNVQSLPHERIIGLLDEAGKAFRVVILKTNLVLPYTSVFIQLDCGYWSAEAEQRLRVAFSATPSSRVD